MLIGAGHKPAHAEHGCRYDKPGYRKAFEQLRSQATLLAVEWADETQTTPALQRLLAQPVTSVGYWGAEVAAGCWYDWSQVPDDLPNFLVEEAKPLTPAPAAGGAR